MLLYAIVAKERHIEKKDRYFSAEPLKMATGSAIAHDNKCC